MKSMIVYNISSPFFFFSSFGLTLITDNGSLSIVEVQTNLKRDRLQIYLQSPLKTINTAIKIIYLAIICQFNYTSCLHTCKHMSCVHTLTVQNHENTFNFRSIDIFTEGLIAGLNLVQ